MAPEGLSSPSLPPGERIGVRRPFFGLMRTSFRLAGAVLVNLLKPLGHILDLVEERTADVKRPFLGGGQGQTIAWPGIDLDDLATQLILLLQNQASEISRVLQ